MSCRKPPYRPPSTTSIDGGSGGGDDRGMEARLSALETKLETVLPTLATKADMAELRGDMHEATASTKTWMVATVVGMMVGFGGLFMAMSNAIKPSPQTPTQPPPIIINVPSAAPPPSPAASR